MISNGLLIGSAIICLTYYFWKIFQTRIQKKSGNISEESPTIVQIAEIIFLILLFIKSADNFGIEWVLVALTGVTGIVWLADLIYSKLKYINRKQTPRVNWIEQTRSFFPILLVVLLVRSFWIEPYEIPSGSLKPSLLVGDFILVNKYEYGLRLPVLHNRIMNVHDPKIGDIVVFRWPLDPSIYFVKRLVGLPGDHIKYVDKILYRNGKPMNQQFEATTTTYDDNGFLRIVNLKKEKLENLTHEIYVRPEINTLNMPEIVVPPGQYFMMGDNRDGSFDSRAWGFVPDKNIVGQATRVFFSWDKYGKTFKEKIRWNRLWKKINAS